MTQQKKKGIVLEISVEQARILHHILEAAKAGDLAEYEQEILGLQSENLNALYFQAQVDLHNELKAIGI